MPLHEKKSSSSNNWQNRKRRLEKAHDEEGDEATKNIHAPSPAFVDLPHNANDERTIDIDNASPSDDVIKHDDVLGTTCCPAPPAPLLPRSSETQEKKGEPEHDVAVAAADHDHSSSVSSRSVRCADHALPSTSSSLPPATSSSSSSPPLPHDDSSSTREKVDDSRTTWEVPCGFNAEYLRTLQIEYWDRTRACKEKKWDHMVSSVSTPPLLFSPLA